MKSAQFLSWLKKAITPPSLAFSDEDDKRKLATLSYLVLLLMGASAVLAVFLMVRQDYLALRSILITDAVFLACLLLARLGKVRAVSQAVPLLTWVLATFLIFTGRGIHDISLLSYPMIIALGGLLQGRRGTLGIAALCTFGLTLIYWGEAQGLIPNSLPFHVATAFDDLIIMTVLLWLTAGLIYLAMDNLSRTVASIQTNEQVLLDVNQKLEQYAAILVKRTEQLMTGAKVARAASGILEPDELSQRVVDLVNRRFGLYFVSLYLLEEQAEWAVLRAGTGKAGTQLLRNGHRLRVGNTSMVGWCIANQKARVALDVGNDAVRFGNPLLPRTRSELALPLISRGEVIGALGIQSEREGDFGEEDVAVFQAMADQLANAIHNAHLYDRLQRELSEKKRAEKAIRKLNAELEQRVAKRTSELQAANESLTALSHLKDEFLANVSHELRTPLTSIMLYHSVLEKKPEDMGRYFGQLKRETRRLAHLIEELLYFSRLDQGQMPFTPAPLDLNRLAQEYVADRKPLAAERSLTLTVEDNPTPSVALADEPMTGQVLSILMTNAMNYTPSGGCITVRTLAKRFKGFAWVGMAVSDTGPGVLPEEREHLFERFYRGKAGRESAAPGTGLGLAIAEEIVRRHDGKIDVQSSGVPGQGTTFLVWLPACVEPKRVLIKEQK